MSARRALAWIAAALLAYVVTLAVLFPASWVGYAIERASQQGLALRDPAGTLWSGSGRLYALERSGEPYEVGALRWKVFPLRLLEAKLVADLVLAPVSQPARVELSLSGLRIRNLNAQIPGALAQVAAPGLRLLEPQGTLILRSENLHLSEDSVLGLADLEWRGLRLARAGGLELGSHVARLRGAGKKLEIELDSLEGPLSVSGNGTWARAEGLLLSGAAEIKAQSDPALGPLLQGLCKDYRERRCVFEIRRR